MRMKIAKFKVSNYRSITDSKQLDLKSLSVLVGPNNEGKSNILRALVVGLQAVQSAARHAEPRRRRSVTSSSVLRYSSRNDFQFYVWENDYPVSLQEMKPDGVSEFELELELNEGDRDELKRRTGHSLNDLLKLRIKLGADTAEVRVIKRGPANSAINDKISTICDLVANRVRVEYVPAERTSSEITRLIQREAMEAMAGVLNIPEYLDALTIVRQYAEEALKPLEEQLTASISSLIPEVRGVRVAVPRFQSPIGRSDFEVKIDDGTMTLLSAKGDGIQSLAVMALMRTLAKREEGVSYILAIEEPESHLHPDAVRRLREDLVNFSKEDQVIITTHSPILVNRAEAAANILVERNAAAPAKDLARIRDSLGIRMPDNLQSANLIVLVEGTHDATILSSILARRSESIRRAFAAGTLCFAACEGSSNLEFQCRVQREAVARVHVVLDSDRAGRKAMNDLINKATIDAGDITVITRPSAHSSEIEDLFAEADLKDMLLQKFNVTLLEGVADSKDDFSTRMKSQFEANGRPWNSRVESNIKSAVAEFVSDSDHLATVPECEPVLAGLQRAVELQL